MRKLFVLSLVVAACGTSGSGDDAGEDATSDAPMDGPGVDASKDVVNEPAPESGPNDAGVPDAVVDGPAPFPCGPSQMCDPATAYCGITSHMTLDGSTSATYGCQKLPMSCFPTPSCACVTTGGPCSCADDAGDITVTCAF